jgi:hypothetical protein
VLGVKADVVVGSNRSVRRSRMLCLLSRKTHVSDFEVAIAKRDVTSACQNATTLSQRLSGAEGTDICQGIGVQVKKDSTGLTPCEVFTYST